MDLKHSPGIMQKFRGKALTFTKIEFLRYSHVLKPEYWPQEYVWVLETFRRQYHGDRTAWDRRANEDIGSANPAGSPHFYVIVDGVLVLEAMGLNGWRQRVAPKLLELERANPS